MSKIIVPDTCHANLKKEITRWLHAKFGPNPDYDAYTQSLIDEWGLPWFRAGALVVDADGKILLGHEGRVNISKIEDANFKTWLQETGRCDSEGWADGDGGWNIPAGRLAMGETFEAGVQREVWEESAHTVEILGIIHVRWSKKFVMPTYLVKDISGPEQYRTENSREILGIGKFSIEGIRALGDAGVLRSPESVLGSLNAYEAYLNGARELNHIDPWEK